ncbi:MAG: hypothetical protein ABR525_05215 [Candidatus Limnocylindria bacterium]
MSFERATAGTGIGAEPASAPGSAHTTNVEAASAAMRLQILSTEHWSLLASRSLAWNESFSRAGMFLSTLSGAIVALALVAQASAFGDGFLLFALVILPVVLFVGLMTVVRLGASNYHDALCVIGMNRIRGAYLELAPELEKYFVMSGHDDVPGIGLTMGVAPNVNPIVHGLAATPAVIGVLNSVLAAVIASIAAIELRAGTTSAVLAGALVFFLAFTLQAWYGRRDQLRGQALVHPVFPSSPTTR